MTLDAKALEAAQIEKVARAMYEHNPHKRQEPWEELIGGPDPYWMGKAKAAIDAADLVERRKLTTVQDGWNECTKLGHGLIAQRDDARLARDELYAAQHREHQLVAALQNEAETQGQQLAALHKELSEIQREAQGLVKTPGGPPSNFFVLGLSMKIPELLTDTAAAAAQWVRVDEWRDFAQLAAHACRESLRYGRPGKHDEYCWCNAGRPTHSPGCLAMRALHDQTQQLLAAAPNLSSVAEGEAGEKEGA